MINREKIEKVLSVMQSLPFTRWDLTISQTGKLKLWVRSKKYWTPFTPEERHQLIGAITPLVGKLEKRNDLSKTDIDFVSESEDFEVRLNRVEVCEIIGYKITKKTQPKMIETGETEEIESRTAITECDIKSGKFKREDVDVLV